MAPKHSGSPAFTSDGMDILCWVVTEILQLYTVCTVLYVPKFVFSFCAVLTFVQEKRVKTGTGEVRCGAMLE